ncbi:MAG: hypothetical protein ACRD6N_20335, partial [Pyrinomonadaceae bacterium]
AMKVAPDFVRPALASSYEVAGRFLLVDVFDEQTSSAIQRFLDRWHVTLVPDADHRTADATLIFREGDAPSIPAELEKFALNDAATGYASDTAYQIVFEDSVMAADESAVVRIWLNRPLDPDDNLLPRIVSYSLPAALRRCGVFELHSGAVINHATGKSILICGPSGSGKSTLTLQLAASGWSYLSDDVVLLSAEAAKVRAVGLRRFFGVTRQTVEASGLPQIDALLGKGTARDFGKRRLEPQEFFPSGLAEECRPNVILFPMITGEATSRMRELSPAETMSRLIRLCPWSCYDRAVAREFLDVLAKLVRQSASFDLFAGSDLMGDPDYTSSFLASAVKA